MKTMKTVRSKIFIYQRSLLSVVNRRLRATILLMSLYGFGALALFLLWWRFELTGMGLFFLVDLLFVAMGFTIIWFVYLDKSPES